ncbi:MAG: transposase [Spirochaetia bacterium]|jgi:hypothetical protein|nr:transposase [Spirochaetia bacterium]
MYRKFTVPIPDVKGKMTRKKGRDGSLYIYFEYDRIYYKDRQYTIPKRACIGKQDPKDDTRMYPNEKYREFFPDATTAEVPEYTGGRSSCLRCGTYVVIRKILEKHRLLQWLQDRFGCKDGGLVMDLAVYLLVSGRNSAQHYPDHAYGHPLFTPEMRIYSDSKVGHLLRETIGRDDTIAFTEWWNGDKDHRKKVYISYDSSNKLCQAGDIAMVEGGHSKSGINGEPIFGLSVALDVKEKLPLFYEDYPGSIVDVSQLVHMVDKARGLGYRNLGFILDRGYFSKANIEYLDRYGYSFIIMAKGRKKLVSSIVLGVKGTFENIRANHLWEYSVNGTTVEAKLYEGDRENRFFHIYYSPFRHSVERAKIEMLLRKLSCELDALVGKDCAELDMERFQDFELTFFGEGKTLVMYRERTEVTERLIDLCGYFCIISSDRMSAREALLLYKARDSSEKLFAADKTFIGSRAERVQSEASLRSRLFIEFFALIVRSRFHACICDHVQATGRKRNYLNVVSVITELEKIELIRIGDGIYRLDHAITARQKEILSVFGLSADDMRSACMDLSKHLAAIDTADIRNGAPDDDIRNDTTVEDEEERQWQEQAAWKA